MPTATFGSVLGVPLASGGDDGRGHRPGVSGTPRPLVRAARDACPGPLRPARVDRARQLTPVRRRPARRPPRPDDRPPEPRAADRPDRGHALAGRPDERADPVAVILLDLDRFKVINESVGHAVGDQLLAAVGQRLVGTLRPSDTVARFGGDEFGIILDPIDDADDARRIAERIGSELRAPFPMGGREWFISASLGIAVGRPGRATAGEMLREAEIAMVRAKSDPSRRYAVFEPSMSDQTMDRIDMENDLRRAIERGELRVHYQPLIDLTTDRIVGFEALVRWQHPVRGLVPPLAFIPLAEETGLILPLGRWVLETACRQAPRWRDARPERPAPADVGQPVGPPVRPAGPRRPGRVRSWPRPGWTRRPLELEITESVVMDQSERRHPDPRPPARHGRPARPRRLRDRLLVAVVPQAPAARHDQDRPDVRGRPRRRRRTARSSRRSSRSPTACASASSPKASRPRPSSRRCARWAATSGRATCSRGRCRPPTADAAAVTEPAAATGDAGDAGAGRRPLRPAATRPARARARPRGAARDGADRVSGIDPPASVPSRGRRAGGA